MNIAELRYLLDSSVFIENWNRYYRVRTFPRVWDYLCTESTLASIGKVKDEIVNETKDPDEWSNIISVLSKKDFFIDSESVLTASNSLNKITRHVYETYKHAKAIEFFKKDNKDVADPLLIAVAHELNKNRSVEEQIKIVTYEQENFPSGTTPYSAKVQIPNVCVVFDVLYLNFFDMLEESNFKC